MWYVLCGTVLTMVSKNTNTRKGGANIYYNTILILIRDLVTWEGEPSSVDSPTNGEGTTILNSMA